VTEINQHLSNLVNPETQNNFKLSGKIYTYPNRKEAVLAYTKLLDIQFLIENIPPTMAGTALPIPSTAPCTASLFRPFATEIE
jgi:hypothetical protein